MTETAGWQNFYVIVGSSAGALIGLQFVVITLIAALPITDGIAQASSAFATPNVVHFGSALLLSAILCAPWHGIRSVAVLWGLVGIAGVVYAALVARRMKIKTAYRPGLEDWLFNAWLPVIAYAILIASAVTARSRVRAALFATSTATLLLLFIGIHNAWDSITYHVFTVRPKRRKIESRAAEHADKTPSHPSHSL
ncbi:MAG: hypothetical protein ACRD4X_12865 [Candidatus Acidiferrales bacterium]